MDQEGGRILECDKVKTGWKELEKDYVILFFKDGHLVCTVN